ncbi:putative Dimodular nonribosomal peptide synthase [Streptomyces aurantiacus JA 4570]|uniref:Putative Dimodular nonribosomal peptide synthase n=2 Tax=Streptomyces aurantiacus TaxID=47760 RepID=S3ZEQ5_9ACTN|nr:putative Dimodular nonribosomal peptide synthase [Streptomyces aurantiacus JA 4570]
MMNAAPQPPVPPRHPDHPDHSPLAGTGLARAVLARARRHPAAIAVVDGEHTLTYADLDTASAAVAGALRRHGVRPGQAVAVGLPRSWQLVCAMLGVLRLGAVVVPLDAQSPPERRDHILTDSASVAVVHGAAAPGGLPEGVRPLAVAALLSADGGEGAQEPAAPNGQDVSFVFYTSGSTGRPKGVEVRDAGILRLARPGYLRLSEGARFACLSNPAFDAISFEVWVPLLTGGRCVILDDETAQTPDVLAAELERLRVDVLFITVALFNAIVDKVPHCFSGIGQVLVGGEQLNARLIRRWYRANPDSPTRLHNVYGPTEATTFALCHPIARDFDGDVIPIGRPLPGTGALPVVDGNRLAAPGEVAELYLSGEALAAGYRNLRAETERRFVTLPWHDGGQGRHYRTGDLVRVDAEGRVEYVERADRQVKVRGFRVEPGELERQIAAHPAVRQAYVCTRRDDNGVNELLAYLVPGAELSYEDFDRHLTTALPAYMRPHRTYRVAELPLNANGKVDKSALLGRDDAPWTRTGTEGPQAGSVTAWQRQVLDLAGRILGVTDLRLGDRWVANGGDSLKALRLRFEIRRRWHRELPQALILRGDFAELAAAIEAGAAQDDVPYPPVAAPTGARSAPATSEQQRLWLLQQRHPDSRAYNVPLVFRLDGEVDTTALRHALCRLVVRYPALRTAFEATPEGLRQRVGDAYDPWVTPAEAALRDEDGRRAFTGEFFAAPFDLASPRLFRACWLPRPGGGELLLLLHHIAVDGWSLNVLFGELSAEYAAAVDRARRGEAAAGSGREEESASPSVPTPLDYAAWQAAWLSSDTYRNQRAQLHEHYGSLPEDTAPLEPVRPATQADGRLLRTSLDAGRRAALDRLCADLGLTRFQLLLGVYAWSLYGVTGRTRPRIAGPVAGRPVQEFEASVGMFANTVLLPLEMSPQEGLRTQLRQHAAAAQAVLDRQDVALADVLADRGSGAGPAPFDFLFVLENTDFGALALPRCEARPEWPAPAEAKCPLTLSVVEHGAGVDCLWEYDARYVGAGEAAALDDLFRRGLDLLADGADPTLAELVAPYRRSLPEPGRAAIAPLDFTTVAEGFARQVRRTPGAPALAVEDRALTYAELDAYAAALAAELRRDHPLPPDDSHSGHVALYFQPSAEHVVALLALARLNLTIVPLDPSYPPALLRQILDQVEPLCVLVTPDDADALDAFAPDAKTLPRHSVTLAADPPTAPEDDTPVPPHDVRRPLYTLFTSGSTGTPKGVRVPDRTLCNLLQWQRESGGLAAPAATQQFSMLSFDVSFQEIFGTLCGGGLLHLVRPGLRQDAPALLDRLETAGIERLFLPYVALQVLAEHGVRLGRHPSRLREVVTAGEQLLCTDAIRRWFAGMPGARLFNHYGPTETHVVSALCLEGDPVAWPERPAIGRPVAGAWLRVVDDADEAVPPGCPGRLLIGGPMAAPCYLGDTALNEERFVDLPGLGTFYRSGDVARFDQDGLLHYLGRDDQQIKLSGHRLELGQVESALLRHPDVVNAVAAQDGGRLVACVQLRDGVAGPAAGSAVAPAHALAARLAPEDLAEDLARHLAPLLPPYVRIDRFRCLERLPLTPSGKLDRRAALTAAGEELLPSRRTAGPALTDRETRLSELFEQVVGRPIDPEQRFFDAGASSLDLMRFHLRCAAEPDLLFTIPDLFEHVTVRRLAAFLDAGRQPDTPEADTRLPLAPADGPIAVIGMAVRLPGADDLAAFWELIRTGARGIEYFDAPDGLVGARSQMSGLLSFDPEHFGISRQEARLMDPQQRHLLMSSVQALAHAGIADPSAQRVGLVAGCGENTYFQSLLGEADRAELPDSFQMALHHDKDFLTTKVAYHLDLSGPAFTVQAACASSLVSVHVAAGLLRQGDADVMLAGGVLVDTLLTDGYAYRPQHIFSKDGHCRPFSNDADGTIGASGVGVVVLKPLSRARRDGDTVYAVITGSALNNDGSGKLSYSAPSLAGQREVIRAALRRSGRTGADLGYVEAHGTGTRLGDPVEVGALRQAFGVDGSDSGTGGSGPGGAGLGPGGSGRCALSSVKSQIGHLGAAAGVVGLVRAALAVHHGVIPPNVDFRRFNPQLGADVSPFYVPAEAHPWPGAGPRVAAVSSFGIGGTNAHLVLEAAETYAADEPEDSPEPGRQLPFAPCLLLSSSSAAGLRADAARIADHLAARPESYGRVLRHLQAGRPARRWRAAAVHADVEAAVTWLRTVSGTEVAPHDDTCAAEDHTPAELADAWLRGLAIHWPPGPAPAPWDFPPPAFDLTEHDFRRAAPTRPQGLPEADWPQRLPEADWLHQPHWVRLSRARTSPGPHTPGLLVAMTATPLSPEALRVLEARYERVVRVGAAAAFARLAEDVYEVDPADPDSLRQLLGALADAGRAGIDWLHALPLAVAGPVGERSLDHARWACLDTPAALMRAADVLPPSVRLRPWWLSYGAQPVEGEVRRPELGLLAGAAEVVPQECAVDGHWLDLPTGEPVDWAAALVGLLAEADASAALPRRLALRQGFWWRQALLPVPAPEVMEPGVPLPGGVADEPGTHVILGGTGGIGCALAAWLLAQSDCRVVLLARRPRLPADLAQWTDRVELIEADLSAEPPEEILSRIERHTGRVDGVVHAAGEAGGALITRRDGAAMRRAMAAKVRGALLTELLIERFRPDFAAYCSSMSALFGGIGQFDYAAAGGLLDAFARHRAGAAETTARIGIGWDIWSEVGMARDALRSDARHQAHLAVGLAEKEGQRLFARALRLQLPHLLVSTTDIERARAFYTAPAGPAQGPSGTSQDEHGATPTAAVASRLTGVLCGLLGLDELDPEASLYDHGADSLTLLDLIATVEEHFGVALDLSRLSHQVSVREVVAHIRDASPGVTPSEGPLTLEVWQEGTGRDLVCLVHPVGGDIQAYRALVTALDPRLTVCLIADPALRRADLPAWSITERARHYHAALEARFPGAEWRWRLAGWSFGAWVAHAMAAEAEASGRPADGLYLLDPPSPDASRHFQAYDETQFEAVFAHELSQGGGGAPASAEAQAYAERLARCCRANVAGMAQHELPGLSGTPTRVWLPGVPVAGRRAAATGPAGRPTPPVAGTVAGSPVL